MARAWLKILYDGMKSFLGASRVLFTLTTTLGPQFAAVRHRGLTEAGDEEFELLGLPVDGVDGLLVRLYICSMLSKLSSKLSFFFFIRGEMLADRRRNPRDLLSELLLLLSSSLANC